MSNFWALWNKAEAGDYAALWGVNVLVAERAGLKIYRAGTIDADAVPGYAEGIGWLQEWISNAAGEAAPIPDYMSDLNAAAGLVLPHGMHMVIATVNTIIFSDDCNVRVFKFGVHGHLVVVHSKSEARARVGAWWAAVTGEVKP